MAKTGVGTEIAEFFTKLGFRIDDKELKKYEKTLDSLKKIASDYKKVLDSVKTPNMTKQAVDKLKIEREQLRNKKEQLAVEKAQLLVDKQRASASSKRSTSSPTGKTPNNLRGFMGNSETVIRLRQDLEDIGKAYKRTFNTSAPLNKELRDQLETLTKKFKQGAIGLDEYKEAMVRWKRSARSNIQTAKDSIKTFNEHNFAVKRAINSTKQYLGTVASVYALVGVSQDIFMKAKEIEGVEAAMLGAADSMELAGDRLVFLRKESERVGINFLSISREFTQLSFAAKGKLNEEQLRELFTGMSQFGTTMKVDAEQMKRSFKAVNQMLNKGQIYAEELKGQLAENLAGSIQIFAKALGVTEQELFKQMEMGLLTAEDVLPKVAKEFIKASEAGGAFQKASASVAAEQNRLANAWSDLVKGLKESTLWVAVAKIFKILGQALNALNPLFVTLGDAIGGVAVVVAKILQPMLTLVQVALTSIGVLNQLTNGWLGVSAGILGAAYALDKFVGLMNILRSHPVMVLLTGLAVGSDLLTAKFSEDNTGWMSKTSAYLTEQVNPYKSGGDVYNVYGTDANQIAESVAGMQRSKY